MKVVSSWLKECLRRTMLNDSELVLALEQAGIEVEQVISSKVIDSRVVVALVNKVVQHPGADRLKLVEVDSGKGILHIVCGAPNVREGLTVALAQIGTILPSGDRIERAKLRGEVSEGMLCSAQELELGQDHNGLLELSSKLVVGTPLAEIYPADTIIDFKTPANRWDLQSVVGLAREIAAMTGENLVVPSPPPVDFLSGKDVLSVKQTANRYSMARVKVNQADSHSPSEIVARLRASGVRSVGPVVDITNYVMLEIGQPLHAFDAAKLVLPITSRFALTGETLVTLDGTTRKLTQEDLVIADATGPIALAGVMGGKSSEVNSDTGEILLESAVFDATTVRKMAQRHGLRSEASARFERGIPLSLPPLGLARALELLKHAASGELVEAYETPFEAPQSWSIALPLSRLVQLLGFVLTYKDAATALARLGIESVAKPVVRTHNSESSSDELIVVKQVPWWRPDLRGPEDLVEEIVRVLGYDNVPSTIPSWRPLHIDFDHVRAVRRRVRELAWASGAFEVMSYSFVSGEQLTKLGLNLNSHLKLKNPLSIEQAYLRSSLLPSSLATLEHNRNFAKSVRFYEISKVFLKQDAGEQPNEPLRLAIMLSEPVAAYNVLKGLLDALAAELNVAIVVKPDNLDPYAPGRSGSLWLGNLKIGTIGQLHPRRLRDLKIEGEAAYFELDLTPLIDATAPRAYKPLSAYPAIKRDLALLLPKNVLWQAVREATANWNVEFVSDYYSVQLPTGTKGMTIRLILALPNRTPTEAEATELEYAVLAKLERTLGAKRRA
jgi:phenylalanyl-tRNA synthetase beta chain